MKKQVKLVTDLCIQYRVMRNEQARSEREKERERKEEQRERENWEIRED